MDKNPNTVISPNKDSIIGRKFFVADSIINSLIISNVIVNMISKITMTVTVVSSVVLEIESYMYIHIRGVCISDNQEEKMKKNVQ